MNNIHILKENISSNNRHTLSCLVQNLSSDVQKFSETFKEKKLETEALKTNQHVWLMPKTGPAYNHHNFCSL